MEGFTIEDAREQGWVYEDQLTEMCSMWYSAWYKESLVIDGVRMGPEPTKLTVTKEEYLK